MTNTITTTCQITFGAGDSTRAHLSAEVDGRPGGLNGGRTSFTGGDPVYILLYKSANVSLVKTLVSAGSLHPAESQIVDVEDIITFADKREARLSKPLAGGLSATWFGNSLGGLTVGEDGVSVTASTAGVAIARVKYKTQASAYRISTPETLGGEREFQIIFFAAGVAEKQL